jgi:hypothetical protein
VREWRNLKDVEVLCVVDGTLLWMKGGAGEVDDDDDDLE